MKFTALFYFGPRATSSTPLKGQVLKIQERGRWLCVDSTQKGAGPLPLKDPFPTGLEEASFPSLSPSLPVSDGSATSLHPAAPACKVNSIIKSPECIVVELCREAMAQWLPVLRLVTTSLCREVGGGEGRGTGEARAQSIKTLPLLPVQKQAPRISKTTSGGHPPPTPGRECRFGF